MTLNSNQKRLSQITTNWSLIDNAHDSFADSSSKSAQLYVLRTYGHCIFRYLLGATRNKDIAEELSQEFAFRFLRGDLQMASPERGRFRDYLKAILRNLVNEHFRNQQKQSKLLANQNPEKVDSFDQFAEIEEEFRVNWRTEILNRTWRALREYQEAKANRYFDVLKAKANNSSETSEQIAEKLSQRFNEPVRSDWVRQTIHRARQKFCQLLKEEIKQTLGRDAPDDALQIELAELKLLKYVKPDS